MIYYEVRFNDGEVFDYNLTKEEAIKIREENNFNFIGGGLSVYECCYSKITGFYSCKKYLYSSER